MTPARSSGRGPFARRLSPDINVTPLVDVMLVLLAIFMVTAPMLATGMKLHLPQAGAAAAMQQKTPIVVSVGLDGVIMVGNEPVDGDTLVAVITAKMGDDTEQTVQVRGDKGVIYGDMVGILDRLAAGGITRVALMTQRTGNTIPTQPN